MLDVACGTGKHLNELKKSFEYTVSARQAQPIRRTIALSFLFFHISYLRVLSHQDQEKKQHNNPHNIHREDRQ